jgi:hypothetical protein
LPYGLLKKFDPTGLYPVVLIKAKDKRQIIIIKFSYLNWRRRLLIAKRHQGV